MTFKNFIGLLLLLSPFLGIFIFATLEMGVGNAIAVFGVTALFALLIYTGVALLLS